MYLFSLPQIEIFKNQQGTSDMARHAKESKNIYSSGFGGAQCVPFDNVEEAWFWFINAQDARNDGARFVAGASMQARPCEPVDVLKILDRLYRNRMLTREHFLVLRHYGRRQMPPDVRRVKEKRSYYLWREAMEKMETPMQRKGIVRMQSWVSQYYPDYASENLVGV